MSNFIKAVSISIALATSSLQSLSLQAQTFTVGVVPQFDVKTLYDIWSPILSTLEEKTSYKFKFIGSKDIPSFEKELASGRFDFAYMNPFHYTNSKHYEPLVKDHGRQLFGILTVKKDSQINSLEQLSGKTIAFPAPNALGASLLMRAELDTKHGIKFVPKYVKTHSSVYLNVGLGLISAGGGVQKTLNQQPDEVKSLLRILYKTDSVQPHPLTAKSTLNQSVKDNVKLALLDMSINEQHQKLLARVPFKKIGLATSKDYDGVRKLDLGQYYIVPE